MNIDESYKIMQYQSKSIILNATADKKLNAIANKFVNADK